MKINEIKLKALIEETIAYGAAYGEEVDVTTNKVMEHLQPLIIAVKELSLAPQILEELKGGEGK